MLECRFDPGFRCSKIDIAVLIVGALATAVASMWAGWIGLLSGWIVVHFFLFCNVFRISRALELIWAGVFIALCAGTIVSTSLAWPFSLAMSFATTVFVVVVEARKPSYHGAWWQWINPNLRQWWETHTAQLEP